MGAVLGAGLRGGALRLEGGRRRLADAHPGDDHAGPHAAPPQQLQGQEAGLPRGSWQLGGGAAGSLGSLSGDLHDRGGPELLLSALHRRPLLGVRVQVPRSLQDFLHRQPPLPHTGGVLGAHGLTGDGHGGAVEAGGHPDHVVQHAPILQAGARAGGQRGPHELREPLQAVFGVPGLQNPIGGQRQLGLVLLPKLLRAGALQQPLDEAHRL